jgi:ubiquinone/menaquinone biosynthesis C-methylase UbiE
LDNLNKQSYAGNELEIFSKAFQWKAYYRQFIAPFIGKRVLEVGAGIGATTSALCDDSQDEWRCLEPDVTLVAEINYKIQNKALPPCCQSQVGTISDLAADELFDSILYIDVLEHIADDKNELHTASLHLKKGSFLVVLSPAYPFLYSPFDHSIGHYRRYTHSSLAALKPENCRLVKMIQLDSVGAMTSIANRFLLHQDYPTEKQILFWDRNLIPAAKVMDKILGYRVGRSIIGIWERIN